MLARRDMVFHFPLGISRLHKRECLEQLDRGRIHDPLRNYPAFASRILDDTKLVQYDPRDLDVLLPLDLWLYE